MLLNLGSGQRKFDKPWINIDVSDREKPDLVCDIRHLPYEDGSADMIVLHHVLEHFHCGEEQNQVLNECHRLLKSGSSLLVFVPDTRKLAQRWLTCQIDDYTFFVNTYGAYQGLEGDSHYWGFTQFSLLAKMSEYFKETKFFDWRKIKNASIARDWWILAIEGIKL